MALVCVQKLCVCVCVCLYAHVVVYLCAWVFHFGQCTNPICMSLILNDVQAPGSVCDGEDACLPS